MLLNDPTCLAIALLLDWMMGSRNPENSRNFIGL